MKIEKKSTCKVHIAIAVVFVVAVMAIAFIVGVLPR